MEARNAIYKQLGLLGFIIKWVDEHPTLSNIFLWLMALGLIWAVFTYEFTIPAYK